MKKSIIALSVLAGLGLTGCGDSDLIRAVKDNTVAIKDLALGDTKAKTDHAEFNRIRGSLVGGVSPLDSITKAEWKWLANFVKGQDEKIKLYKEHVDDHGLEEERVKVLFTDETVTNGELTSYLDFIDKIYKKSVAQAQFLRGLSAKEIAVISKLDMPTAELEEDGKHMKAFLALLPEKTETAVSQAKYRKLMTAAKGILGLANRTEAETAITLLKEKASEQLGTPEAQVEFMLTQVGENIQGLAEEIEDPKKQLEMLDSAVNFNKGYTGGARKWATENHDISSDIDDWVTGLHHLTDEQIKAIKSSKTLIGYLKIDGKDKKAHIAKIDLLLGITAKVKALGDSYTKNTKFKTAIEGLENDQSKLDLLTDLVGAGDTTVIDEIVKAPDVDALLAKLAATPAITMTNLKAALTKIELVVDPTAKGEIYGLLTDASTTEASLNALIVSASNDGNTPAAKFSNTHATGTQATEDAVISLGTALGYTVAAAKAADARSEEHTSELQSL
jgi:hypothetical protein